MDNYDKTKEYTKYVKPIVSELKKECGLNNIPSCLPRLLKIPKAKRCIKTRCFLHKLMYR